MNPESQRLVRESFAKVAPIAPAAAAMFYERLFVLDPALRPLFKGDMAEQGRKLMSMIGVAVANLGRLDAIVPTVRELGRRHAGYGVQQSHYDTVGTALVWTLEQGLGMTSRRRRVRPGSKPIRSWPEPCSRQPQWREHASYTKRPLR